MLVTIIRWHRAGLQDKAARWQLLTRAMIVSVVNSPCQAFRVWNRTLEDWKGTYALALCIVQPWGVRQHTLLAIRTMAIAVFPNYFVGV